MTQRTPLRTTESIKRRPGRPRQTVLYSKTVTIPLSGIDPKELQEVAAAIHLAAASHPLCIGGKDARKVFVQKTVSFVPTKIFDGVA